MNHSVSSLKCRPENSRQIVLRLYVAGQSRISLRAMTQARRICRQIPRKRFVLEIVDIARQPLRALAEGVLVTPTLLKVLPRPMTQIVGDLSHPGKVLLALGVIGYR